MIEISKAFILLFHDKRPSMKKSLSMKLTIIKPSNMHTHVRQLTGANPLLPSLVPLYAENYYYFVAMPNTTPPIKTGVDKVKYWEDIYSHIPQGNSFKCEPIIPIKLLWNEDFKTTPKVIEDAHDLGVRCAKMYPLGVTTNSQDGIGLEDISKLKETFQKMAELGWILQIHGEHPGKEILATHREYMFHPHFVKIHEGVPNLKMIFEHISDRRTIDLVKQMPSNIAGTLSTHFMYITLNDVVEPGLRPQNSCKPIAKKFEDRDAIVDAAISGNPKFFWGSDIAPHIKANKYKDCGACGCFPGPHDTLWVLKKFEEMNALDRFEDFMSIYGPKFYGLPIPKEKVTFNKVVGYETAKMYQDIEIWKGGEIMNWALDLQL